MPTQEILKNDWPEFFADFSSDHEGISCTLEVLGSSIGAQVETRGLPLMGVSVSRDRGKPSLAIAVGDQADAHVTHTISAPDHVWLKRSDAGTDEVLEIVAADTKTLLTLELPPKL